MEVNWPQLEALVAIDDTGTFEAAARQLLLTPSAISQRIRALEAATGGVLVVRSTPCRLTPQGLVLVRLGRQLALLSHEADQALHPGSGRVELSIALNADSLATWFVHVLADAGRWADVTLRLIVDDQDHTAELLRSGTVLGAVTSQPVAVQGCSSEPIGVMRYLPVAAAELVATLGGLDLATAPIVQFDVKDTLQERILRRAGVTESPPTHRVPSSEGFAAAVRVGLGWGAMPVDQLGDDLATGRLVRISDDYEDVPLFWQRWRLDSAALSRLTECIRRHAPRVDRPT